MSESSPTAVRAAVRAGDGDETTGLGRRRFLRAGAGAAAGAAAVGAAAPAAAQAYGGWMSDVGNYEGTLDYTGNEEVTVSVGAGENGLLFDPPAILVDPGTTVVWEWTGEGVPHNVVHQPEGDGDPAFETELISEAGATFEYTFEEEATFRYYCSPHRAVGMKGVVAVGSTDDEVIDPDAGGGGDGGGGGPLTTSDLLILAAAVGLVAGLVLAVVAAAGSPDGDQSSG
ncbi:halocyanin domain-containing protein [Natronomonas marina]|jgi:halocyanin-like protein|uniref:halocyanin domain-containing protein n=1 Tax=Natronomonas marina TaxID=2961939 RepID=UPI0020C98927|nr:halocyanin domain-containing protein [Natronomonas marina]